jgi:hypothetical protein
MAAQILLKRTWEREVRKREKEDVIKRKYENEFGSKEYIFWLCQNKSILEM